MTDALSLIAFLRRVFARESNDPADSQECTKDIDEWSGEVWIVGRDSRSRRA